MLQNDSLTKGNTQCNVRAILGFYFKVTNTRKGARIRFHIINMAKKDLMYEEGMRIALHSEHEASKGWFHGGSDIRYFPNTSANSRKPVHVLSFTYEFLHDHDTVSMAFAQPYTLTDMSNDLANIEHKPNKRYTCSRKTLCITIGGCPCETITLTGPKQTAKKTVILTARVHAGETVSSWMLKGVLDFLTSGSAAADALLEKYVFRIVPCLNPDGVVQGNYRCSLSGADLNRKFASPSSVLHPSVYHLKALVRSVNAPVALYCDLHGHSKKKDVFAYGNKGENIEEFTLFPYILSKVNPYFSYEESRFSVSKYKASTARIAMWKELHVPAVYTVEASFFGPTAKGKEHFSTEELVGVGRSICQALVVYSEIKGDLPVKRLEEVHLAKSILSELKKVSSISTKKVVSEDSNDDTGSDSNSPENETDIKEVVRMIAPSRKVENATNSNIDKILIRLMSNSKHSYKYYKKSVMSSFKDYAEDVQINSKTESRNELLPPPKHIITIKNKTRSKPVRNLAYISPIKIPILERKVVRNSSSKPPGLEFELVDGSIQDLFITKFHSSFNKRRVEGSEGARTSKDIVESSFPSFVTDTNKHKISGKKHNSISFHKFSSEQTRKRDTSHHTKGLEISGLLSSNCKRLLVVKRLSRNRGVLCFNSVGMHKVVLE
eukprot:TRINITY_DN601_c0_g6_i1.p1 TRINITY_DN601_c0_g6~~TRINITY_DN601_c0_g6_i1.p1  ORF type:complete len:664 (-),score=128.42 TRINITY_DN601_c0_g6_i1:465-2456(-)